MKKLIQGIKEFRKTKRPHVLEKFGEMALAQKPDTILVVCSDSRVAPNVFASTSPGDMFVLRNIGNIIPPYKGETSDPSVLAMLEFGLTNLPIKDIIVCGHSNCGAMHAILSQTNTFEGIKKWLDSAQVARIAVETLPSEATPEEKANAISKLSVLKQIDNLKTYPIVQKRLKENNLFIHAWYFDIKHADVYSYDFTQHNFLLIE